MGDGETLRGGRYVVTRRLGEGSQGLTFEAVDKREGRLVAVKRFDVRGAKTWKDVELAEREARVLASLSHPRLPAYIEHFEEDGHLYLVMEKVEGRSLSERQHAGERLTEDEVLHLLRDADAALAYLHDKGVIHRDLKPGNVIQKKDGSFAFVDFGSVRDRFRAEGGSTVVGTFGFMAPEQFQGRALPGSDVYAVAATCLTMLTGKQPEDLPHKGLAIDVRGALGRTVSEPLVAALSRMLDPDPEVRPSRIEIPAPGFRGRPAEPSWWRARDDPRARHDKGDDRRAWQAERDDRQARRREDPHARHAEHESRHDRRRWEREERHARRRAARAERRAERHARMAGRGRMPFFPLMIVLLALAVARLAVSLALFVVVPAVLVLLSTVFGPALREAARTVTRRGREAYDAIEAEAQALAGRAPGPGAPGDEEARVRVAPDRVRVGDDTEAEYEREAEHEEERERER